MRSPSTMVTRVGLSTLCCAESWPLHSDGFLLLTWMTETPYRPCISESHQGILTLHQHYPCSGKVLTSPPWPPPRCPNSVFQIVIHDICDVIVQLHPNVSPLLSNLRSPQCVAGSEYSIVVNSLSQFRSLQCVAGSQYSIVVNSLSQFRSPQCVAGSQYSIVVNSSSFNSIV